MILVSSPSMRARHASLEQAKEWYERDKKRDISPEWLEALRKRIATGIEDPYL